MALKIPKLRKKDKGQQSAVVGGGSGFAQVGRKLSRFQAVVIVVFFAALAMQF